MRQRRTVGPVKLPRAAELALAEFRAASPKFGRGLVEERDAARRVRGVDRRRQRLQKFGRTLHASVRVSGSLLWPFAEDIHRADDSTSTVFDRLDVHQCNNARAVGSLDGDLLVTQSMAGGEDVGHRTLGMRYEAPVQAVQAIGAAIANRGVAQPRRATPQFGGGAIVADDQAGLVADVDADRQQI